MKTTGFFWKKFGTWLLALAGLGMLLLALRGIPVNEILQEIAAVQAKWLVIIFIPSFATQLFRSWRWQLLLSGAGEKTKFWQVYHSLLFGYFVNLALPRVGEISRCVALQQQGKIPFIKSLGTVVSERIIDLLCLFLVIGVAFFLQREELGQFWQENIYLPLASKFSNRLPLFFFIFLALIPIGIGILYWWKRLSKRIPLRYRRFFLSLWHGIRGIAKLNHIQIIFFVLLSVLIWTGYFLTTWFWFFALSKISDIPFSAALTVMVVGSIAKTLPLPGGSMGAYHLLTGGILILYGLGDVGSQTFAILNHGYQTAFYLVIGGISALRILQVKKPAK